jgi:hypothetical protein
MKTLVNKTLVNKTEVNKTEVNKSKVVKSKEIKNDDEITMSDTESLGDTISIDKTKTESSDEELVLDSDESKLKMLKNLKYDFASYEIKYIYETYLKNSDEIDLNPSYQREFSWSCDKQDLFIDSVVNNYIIPPIILIKLNKKNSFKYECMDGQHRLTVLKHFIEGRPINPKVPHHIKFTKKENNTLTDIYYQQIEDLEKIQKSHRYMNDDELSAFNDKKLIVIKISNFDKNMDEVFDKIKNEMFLRLQKGERVSGTDVLRNHDSIFVNVLREHNLLKLKTFQTHDSYKRLSEIMDNKAKKNNPQLNLLIYFIIRAIMIINKNDLDVGLLNENTLRDEMLNKKTKVNRFDISESDIITALDKIKKFITRIYKMKEQTEIPKLNEYLLLVLLKIYLDEKDNLNTCLENFVKIAQFNDDKYYDKLFTKNINNKKIKIIQGKYLEKPFDDIKELILNIR